MKDYYSILGVQPTATFEEISTAFKKRLKVVHPDRFDARTQPDEWQQANKMLQELNEAFDYLKKTHNRTNDDSTSSRQYSNSNTSQDSDQRRNASSQNTTNSTEYTKTRPPTSKGATQCPIDMLNLNHIHFIKHLIDNKNETLIISNNNIVLNYAVFIAAGYFYVSNTLNWLKLNLVIEEYYWLGVILLIILSTLMAKCGLSIYRYHKSKIRPCTLFTPMYYIRVKYDQVIFAYSWEIESYNFYKEKYLSYFNIKVGNLFDKFYVPITFSFERFKKDIDKINKIRLNVKDVSEWLTTNDILRDLRSEPSKRNPIPIIVAYSLAVITSIGVSTILSKSFTIVDSSVPAAARIENYASKEAQQPASEISPTVISEVPRNTLNIEPQKSVTAFNKPQQPLPNTGKEYYYSGGKGVAPLEIIVPNQGEHYFVKIVNAQNNKNIKAVFIRSGERVKIKVPLGTYKVKYATGLVWFGREYLFGPNTHVTIADSDFEFMREGNQVSGYTIELVKQVNGNLHSRDIPLEEF